MKKRLCSMLLCAALILSSGGLTAKAAATTAPKMTVEVNQVTGGTTVEVSLIAKGGTLSQSAHAVLSYDPTKLTLKSWGDGGLITPTATPMAGSTMAPGNVAGKPSLVYQPDGSARALLYLGASDAQNGMAADKALVTVQFAYAGDGKTGDITEGNLNDYVSIAAAGSFDQLAMAAYPVMLHLKDETSSRYIYGYGEPLPAGYQAMTVDFVLESKPSLYNNTGAVVSGDYAITFFDWDGSVVDVAAVGADATEQAAQAQGKLTAKKGYAFDRWLLVKQGDGALVTQYGTFTSNANPLDGNNKDIAKLTAVSGNLLVQAAYTATDQLNSGLTDGTKVHYSVTATAFTRYGDAMPADGKYSITLTVERKNKADFGVTRARTPGVVVKMTPTAGGQAIYTLLTLDNTDVTTCEIVPNKQIAAVEYYFIDVNTSPSNWPGAGNLSPLNVSISKDGKNGFRCLGTVGFINELVLTQKADSETWATAMNAQTFQDAMLTYKDIARARDALYTAIKTADKPLTQAEMQTAIGNN